MFYKFEGIDFMEKIDIEYNIKLLLYIWIMFILYNK